MRRMSLLIAAVLAGCVSQAPSVENFHNVDHQFLMTSAGHWKALASLSAHELVTGNFDLSNPKSDTTAPGRYMPYPTNDSSEREVRPALCKNAFFNDPNSSKQPSVVFGKDPAPSEFSRAYRDLLTSQLATLSVEVAPATASDDPGAAPTTGAANDGTAQPGKLTLDISVRVDQHALPPAPPGTFFGLGTLLGAAGLIAREPPSINPVQSLVVGASGGYFIDMTRQYFPDPTDAEVIVSDTVHNDQTVKCSVSYVLYVPSIEADKYIGEAGPAPTAHPDICGEYYCESTTYYFEEPPKNDKLAITLTSVAEWPTPVNLSATGTGSSASAAVASLIQDVQSKPDFHIHFVDVSVGSQPTAIVIHAPKRSYLVTTVNTKSVASAQHWNIATAPYPSADITTEGEGNIPMIASAVKADGTKTVWVVGFERPTDDPGYSASHNVCDARTKSVATDLMNALHAIAIESVILDPEFESPPAETALVQKCFSTVGEKDNDVVIVSEATGAPAATVSALSPPAP